MPSMPITLLDIILLVVMLVSGLLAMVRGLHARDAFDRLLGRGGAGDALCLSKLLPFAKQYFNNDIVAAAVSVGGIFLGTLLIVSVLTVTISDMVLDSRVGALDRTLGFLFGLARGLVIVVVAFMFFDWLVPDRSQPDGSAREVESRAAKHRPMADVDVAGRPRKHHLEDG